MNLMQPKTDDPQQQQANVILKVLPFMIGWFALNVPAALGVYWVVNNIVTTATTLYVRSTMPKIEPVSAGGAAASVMEATTTDFNPTPMNDRAVGFGGASEEGDVMTTITPVDAEIVEDGATAVLGDGPDIPGAPKGKVSKATIDHLSMNKFLFTYASCIMIGIIRGEERRRRRGERTKQPHISIAIAASHKIMLGKVIWPEVQYHTDAPFMQFQEE